MDSALTATTDVAMMQPAPHLGKMGRGGNIDKTAKDFEGMFMSQMMQPMFDGLTVDPLFGGGNGEKVMRSFLVQEYGKLASNSGHLGIADAVKKEMIRAQAAAMGAIPSATGDSHGSNS